MISEVENIPDLCSDSREPCKTMLSYLAKWCGMYREVCEAPDQATLEKTAYWQYMLGSTCCPMGQAQKIQRAYRATIQQGDLVSQATIIAETNGPWHMTDGKTRTIVRMAYNKACPARIFKS